jgi:hypothetical protein
MKNRVWILTILSLAFTVGAASAQTKRKKTQPKPVIPVTTQQIIEQNQPEIINPEVQPPIENQTGAVTENQTPSGEQTTESQSFQSKPRGAAIWTKNSAACC